MELIVTLYNGSKIRVAKQGYSVEIWESGEWKILACFPGTVDGYTQAQALAEHECSSYSEVRIQQFF